MLDCRSTGAAVRGECRKLLAQWGFHGFVTLATLRQVWMLSLHTALAVWHHRSSFVAPDFNPDCRTLDEIARSFCGFAVRYQEALAADEIVTRQRAFHRPKKRRVNQT
jgi:hypothetical protein